MFVINAGRGLSWCHGMGAFTTLHEGTGFQSGQSTLPLGNQPTQPLGNQPTQPLGNPPNPRTTHHHFLKILVSTSTPKVRIYCYYNTLGM